MPGPLDDVLDRDPSAASNTIRARTLDRPQPHFETLAEVLSDPDIGGFDIGTPMIDEDTQQISGAAGDSTTADQHYRAALTIAERLAAADPGNTQYQRDLADLKERLDSLRSPESWS